MKRVLFTNADMRAINSSHQANNNFWDELDYLLAEGEQISNKAPDMASHLVITPIDNVQQTLPPQPSSPLHPNVQEAQQRLLAEYKYYAPYASTIYTQLATANMNACIWATVFLKKAKNLPKDTPNPITAVTQIPSFQHTIDVLATYKRIQKTANPDNYRTCSAEKGNQILDLCENASFVQAIKALSAAATPADFDAVLSAFEANKNTNPVKKQKIGKQ